VCRPALAPPFPAVDLIPLGDDRFAMGRIEGGAVREVYWPGRNLVFARRGDDVIGYELEYEPQVVVRARKYRWELAPPARRREPIPQNLAGAIAGRYESGYYGTIDVWIEADTLHLDFGSGEDDLLHQGAGYFVNERGDLVTFGRDPESGRWQLRVLEVDGSAYEFERPDGPR
jgi:hypothetical protein